MINIYSTVEDLECTEYFRGKEELVDRLEAESNSYLINLPSGIEFHFLSDSHVEIYSEDGEVMEDLEAELAERLEEIYTELVEELEEQEDDQEEEW